MWPVHLLFCQKNITHTVPLLNIELDIRVDVQRVYYGQTLYNGQG